jgi:hypothetical protein
MKYEMASTSRLNSLGSQSRKTRIMRVCMEKVTARQSTVWVTSRRFTLSSKGIRR